MLIGYSLLSPRRRLSSEAHAQFQACHFTSMSMKRLDLTCGFARKDGSRPLPVRPVLVEKPVEVKTVGCSLRQNNIVLPPQAEGGKRDGFRCKSLKKRYVEDASYYEETCMSRAKRKRHDGFTKGRSSYWFNVQHSVPVFVGFELHHVPFSISFLEWDQRVWFKTEDVEEQPLPPLSNIPWFDFAVKETKGSEGKNVDSRRGLPKEASRSPSTSSGSRGLVLGPSSNPVKHDIGNCSTPPSPTEITEDVVAVQNDENNVMEHDCVELVSLLVASVEHIGLRNVPALDHCLARLGDLASAKGSSPIHRLIAYYTEALALRVTRLWPDIFTVTPPREFDWVDEESGEAWGLLNEVSPIPKFVHFTSNELLLRAFEGKDRVHIIDFDLKQGLQWPSLFQSLSARTNPPGHVRVTAVGESKLNLNETGDRLAGFAAALSLPFEFHPVVCRLEDVRLWMLHVKAGETVAVNCAFQVHKLLYDITGESLNNFLGLIRSTRVELVITTEQEGAHNDPNLDSRLANSLKYYSAIFDGLDSSLPLNSLVRVKVEEMFAREIRNIVACEGQDRYERHETFSKWKDLMEQGGFCCKGISEREVLQSKMLLQMYSKGNYSVHREKDGAALTLSWSDQLLYTVSSWSPVDVMGSSSLYPQPS